MALDVAWLGCDLVTGQIIEELADLRPTGPLRRLIGEDQSMQLTLPLPKLGTHGAPAPNWEAATEPGRTLIVAVVNGVPLWGGLILVRQGGTSALLTLGTVTCEGYLDHRYVGDHTWTQKDEASVIAAGLLKDANLIEGIGLIIDAPPTGRKRDRQYYDKDNKTVKSALQELSGVIDGIEWTIDLEWGDATETWVRKVARVRKRLGAQAPGGGPVVTYGTSAAAVFDTPAAADTSYEYSEDYSDGRGGNHVIAWSSGEGEDMPFSAPARDEILLAAGWPRFEERFQPSTSIINVATLNNHALERLALIGRGIVGLDLTARADVYPRLGDDWNLGDDIGYELIGHWHRDGLVGQARAIGWELEPQRGTVKPLLLSPPGGFAEPTFPNWVANPSFEEDTEGWMAGGSTPPTIARSSDQAHDGAWSLLVTWPAASVAGNLLPANIASIETDASGWPNGYNCTRARSTAQAQTGAASLAMTATMVDVGFGSMTAYTATGVNGVPVAGGELYLATIHFRAAVNPRRTMGRLAFYNAAGVYVGEVTSGGLADGETTTGWLPKSWQGASPPSAARVAVEAWVGSVLSKPVVGEVHYIDGISLRAGSGASFPQVQTTLANLVPGTVYNAQAWVLVPAGGKPVALAVGGVGVGQASSLIGAWQPISFSWRATATSHSLQLWADAGVVGGEQVYLDDVEVTAA